MISVDLYLLKPANTDADQLSLLQTLLSPEERQTWQSIGQLARRQEYLLSRDYPGNIRDLRNLTLRMAHRHVGRGPITIGDIPTDERPTPAPDRDHWRDITFEQSIRRALLSGAGLREIRHAAEDTAIHIAMGEEDGNLQRAARRLGLSDRALQLRRAEQRQKSALDEAV